MAAVTYIARRSLAGGHVVNTQYSLDIQLLSSTGGGTRRRRAEEIRSLDGGAETQYYGHDLTIECQVPPFLWADQPFLREFLDSTEDGQVLTFDLYGSVAIPANPIPVVRADDGYSEERALSLGTGGAGDYFKVVFSVRYSE